MSNPTIISISNSTACASDDTLAPEFGYVAALVAVVFYGSNFVPVKKYETGDGMFFQWVMSSAIITTGIVIQLIRRSTFYPLAMVGGVAWATGNLTVVPIIKTIGMGLGLCIWGMSNLLSGWATGRFGFFGITPEVPEKVSLNYIGVSMAVFSAFIFSLIKNELHPPDEEKVSQEDEHKLLRDHMPNYGASSTESLYTTTSTQDILVFNRRRGSSINRTDIQGDGNEDSFIERMSPARRRIVGLILSLVSGVLYGQMFTGATHVQDNVTGASQNGLDYVFACFCGIYLSSTVYYCIYTIIMKNRPRVYPKVIFPGIISGVMWAIATSAWFLANKVLSNAVAFPIVTTIPAVIASVWSVFVFKEIKGIRNIGILLVGFCFSGGGAILAGLSKGAGTSLPKCS
ncbi:transmembrane protein 144-like [Mizuhopecten yessoensis]|uniref:Transmembrane protein 144 n=1 Tax=Mizuhopecten yessoensis TaxID=6573 RepID=A0A210PXS5_MIZYE|nr:transmembrane protein 144-like [Mizuhopecten yessoensis]XP_021372457.1 transmembrane protein 144-like [Mizuhopecten yessoensis]OWF41287.1 Transmembrane protein 144 [Mizuhopecten yessoensis]